MRVPINRFHYGDGGETPLFETERGNVEYIVEDENHLNQSAPVHFHLNMRLLIINSQQN